MDPSPNSNDDESTNTESLTSTLKGMLKINGNPTEVTAAQATEEETPSKSEEAAEEESKKDSADEDPSSVHTDTEGGDAQRIDLSQASDGECIPIYGSDVTIVTSPSSDTSSKTSGSNKVRIKPITKFEWTHKYYDGDLVSVTNNYMAYAIKSRAFAVRVINRKNSSDRLLLRGFSAPVCDVSFAHPTSSLVSAVDEDGNFLVWQLSLNGDSTTAIKKLHVKPTFNDSTYHRLVWLTFMHCDIDNANVEELLQLDPEDEPDPASHKRLLAVSHGRTVEVWDINTAFEIAAGDQEHTEKDKLAATYMTIKHDDVVSDCELSPEGSVIAVASHDGFVKFWQVSIENTEEPSCLHKWKPHGDRPVSLVTFCDDRTQAQLVLYWRFMLTGCSQNSELKIWCTVSWSCLQTISFEPSPGPTLAPPAMKCVLHAAADYLVIADVTRKVVYVMQCVSDLDNGKAFLSSISQYLLTKPLLSFEIVEAYKCKFKNLIAMDEEVDREEQDDIAEASDEEKDEEDQADEASLSDEVAKKTNGVLIKLISITTKSLESLDIRFVPRLQTDEAMSYSTYNTISDDLNVVSVDESLSMVSPSLENGQDDELEQARREVEEEEEADSTKNKTTLTANDGDQSTILATNNDETQKSDKDDVPATPERPVRVLTPLDSSLGANVLDLLDTDEPPIAHSSPSVNYISQETQNRGQGEGEAAESPDKPEQHPVLLTPEAFTSSLRKPEDLMSAESSFTRVTPFSADHPSLFESERDKSLQESIRAKSPALPPSVTPPPGFPPISTTIVYKPEAEREAISLPAQPITTHSSLDIERDVHSLPPIIQPAATRSSLDIGSSAQPYSSILQSISANEPGPFGDVQSAVPMTKDQSPDLISSASSIENAGSDARVLIGGPLPGAVGGSGDSLFLSGQSKAGNEMDARSDISNSSKKSDRLPIPPSAPWPKAPDVTMSRPLLKKPTQPHTREEFLRTSDMSQQSQISAPPDAIPNANLASGDQIRPGFAQNMGADILSAIASLQKQQEEMQRSIQKDIAKKMNQITKNIESSQRKFEQQQNEKLDRALKNMVESQKKFQMDNRSYSVSATEQAAGKIDKAIKQEMRNTVVPHLAKTLDPLKDQLHHTLAQKLTATDSLLKESMGKLVRSKETLDAIGGAAGRAVQSQVHVAYKESFSQVVIPAFEKQCNLMFQQISVTFQRGMDDAVSKLEKQLQSRVKTEVERISLIEKQAREATSELRDTATHLHSKITSSIEQEVQKLVRTEMKRVQESMSSEISKTFKRQHEAALKEQKAVLTECIRNTMADIQPQQVHGQLKSSGGKTARPGTPGRSPGPLRPTFEMQQQAILNHLHQGNVNAAFQRALTASDLSLVMYVCEMIDPAVVFGATPCPLHQPIILSLIQQLSCDLGRNTMTKLRYLQEAVMNLDSSHQVTQEHMYTVLDALVKSLDGHVATLNAQPTDASNTSIIKQMKMLSMAAKSLIQ